VPKYRLKHTKRRAQDCDNQAALVNEDVQYPKVIITEVLIPNNALKALAQCTSFAGIQYHDLNGCRNIIQAYIENNYLDKESDV